jgi:IS605 OrfB family transposase
MEADVERALEALLAEVVVAHLQEYPENVACSRAVGVDRGLMTFAVVADSAGEVARFDSPRPLRRMRSTRRSRSKDVGRKEVGSRNRRRARAKLAKTHARISSVRRDFLHELSTQLVKNHGPLVIEDLCTAGMMKTRLARSVADSAWGLFGSMLTYKASWYGATLVVADRFFPSTRRCSACGVLGDKLDLSTRFFRCSRCGHAADRDTNAAVNLANYSAGVASGQQLDATSRGPRSQGTPEPHVAAKHAETQNVCGEESSRARHLAERETTLATRWIHDPGDRWSDEAGETPAPGLMRWRLAP